MILENIRKHLTNKHKRYTIVLLAFNNKIKQEKNKMQNKIKQFHNKLSRHKPYRNVCLFARVLLRTGKMLVPAGFGSYLVLHYSDKIVLAIAGLLLAYSLLAIVNSAYLSEASINKTK